MTAASRAALRWAMIFATVTVIAGWFKGAAISVVLPLPRKPVTIETGPCASAAGSVKDVCPRSHQNCRFFSSW